MQYRQYVQAVETRHGWDARIRVAAGDSAVVVSACGSLDELVDALADLGTYEITDVFPLFAAA